ncbi:hypothetical protein RFI_09941 [Reticulomyxa filosa]|uniref:Pesticin C-terminal domain-containing protein n=1 Tax=Reticulomyxa filosa TaxID=46433 RepID=X6NMN3_RETFI|nr:hypothetical protein RFI_09941 [Reticulomyxa filosa]|eukprot:ETO27193.1 hypothetical protein RFI_09941 [Reticulomyxa filosa]
MKTPDDFKRKENTDDPSRKDEKEWKESRERESGTVQPSAVSPEAGERTDKDTTRASSGSDFTRSEKDEKKRDLPSKQEEKRDIETRQEEQRERQKEREKERGEKVIEEREDRERGQEERERERERGSKPKESTVGSTAENVKEAFGKNDKEKEVGPGMTQSDRNDRRDLKEKNEKKTSAPSDPTKGVRDPKSYHDMTHRDERRDVEERSSERERKMEVPKTRGFPETERKKDVSETEMKQPSQQQQQQGQVASESKTEESAAASRSKNDQLSFSKDISNEKFDSFKQKCGNGSLDNKDLPTRHCFTFLIEGREQEDSPFHSRKIHLPPNSGVTIGRGYDLGQTSTEKFLKMMNKIGVSRNVVDVLKPAVGKTKDEAKTEFDLLQKNPILARDILTKEQQRLLFCEHAKEHEEMVTSKCKQGWNVDFSRLHPLMQDILFDLCFRDDLHPSKQSALRSYVEKNNLNGLYKVMQNKEMWEEVPADRFQKRCEYLEMHIRR